MKRYIGRAILIAAVTCALLARFSTSQAMQPDWRITRVADRDTPIPGGSGTFTSVGFGGISGDNIAFLGAGISGQEGIYLSTGLTIQKIADKNTPMPGTSGNFEDLTSWISLSGRNVTFRGRGQGLEGIFLYKDGTITTIADNSTPVPQGVGRFTGFSRSTAILGDSVVFVGTDASGSNGIYIGSSGTITKVVDANTPIPGENGTFSSVSGPTISDRAIVFHASGGGGWGIYASQGGLVTKIADLHTPISNGSGTFTSLSEANVSGGRVVFAGRGDGAQAGIYKSVGGVIEKVADTGTKIPGGTGNFVFLGSPSISYSGDLIVFEGSWTQPDPGSAFITGGIFAQVSGAFQRILGTGDQIEGKPVDRVNSPGRGGQSGNSIMINVEFSIPNSQSSGIYRADYIPDSQARDTYDPSCEVNWEEGHIIRGPFPAVSPLGSVSLRIDCREIDPRAAHFSTEVYLMLLEINDPHEPKEPDLAKVLLRMPPEQIDGVVLKAKSLRTLADRIEKAALRAKEQAR